jgi:N6-L-threonylcarbamoyladenine synthase
LAEEAREKNIRLDKKFPRPMIHSGNLNFSFSGLKTAVLYYLRDLTSPPNPLSLSRRGGEEDESPLGGEVRMAVVREFEDSVIETLVSKTKKAIEKYFPKSLIIGGGVIANKALRENFLKLEEIYLKLKVLIPEKSLTTDNATMIAAAGYIEYLKNQEINELKAQGNLNI